MFKRADARGGGDASAGARLAAHKQQQQQQQESAAVGAMDGARIKANQIANLRLMAVLNYRFAVCGLRFAVLQNASYARGRNQKKATRGEGGGGSSYL